MYVGYIYSPLIPDPPPPNFKSFFFFLSDPSGLISVRSHPLEHSPSTIRVHILKENWHFLSPGSFQLSIALQLGMGTFELPPSPLHAKPFRLFCRFCTGNQTLSVQGSSHVWKRLFCSGTPQPRAFINFLALLWRSLWALRKGMHWMPHLWSRASHKHSFSALWPGVNFRVNHSPPHRETSLPSVRDRNWRGQFDAFCLAK